MTTTTAETTTECKTPYCNRTALEGFSNCHHHAEDESRVYIRKAMGLQLGMGVPLDEVRKHTAETAMDMPSYRGAVPEGSPRWYTYQAVNRQLRAEMPDARKWVAMEARTILWVRPIG